MLQATLRCKQLCAAVAHKYNSHVAASFDGLDQEASSTDVSQQHGRLEAQSSFNEPLQSDDPMLLKQ